ncbi:MAG: hypothetical protein MUP66_03270 [Candidatus Nanohaloarchaeota archaeon QJJ-5]|nr:hypothetical protein [Candidatus Nanohaloarchaeota archaeon QJJ-5]
MKRKGISPLIGAVLLIAFTMAVAAILTAWVTTFTQDTADTVGNESERLVECSYAGLSIYDAVLSGEDVTISVANTGTVPVGDVTVITFLDNGSVIDSEITGLDTGDVQEITMSGGGIGSSDSNVDIDRVRITSEDCPEVSDETSDIA